MKRFALAAAATLMAVSPLAATGASAQDYRGDRDGRYDNDRGRDNDRRDNDRGDRRDRRDDDRRGDRWDQRRHNGYYLNGRFFYGEPTFRIMQRRDYQPGWRQWRRGERLHGYGRAHYREVDWRRERLRQPPRGYHYVRDDRGEVLLVGIATGVILSILLSN